LSDTSISRPLHLCSPTRSFHNVTLPPYIKPLPPSISDEDLEYLASKGALAVPTDELRNALLQSYIDFVHPYMPIVLLSHLIQVIEQGTGEGGTISLLLLQSIMFAGVAFVDAKCLTKGGFETRKIARRILFHRARVSSSFTQIWIRINCWLGPLRLQLRA
jgi:hypothetical protein